MAGGVGFEPTFTVLETALLPLHYPLIYLLLIARGGRLELPLTAPHAFLTLLLVSLLIYELLCLTFANIPKIFLI